MIKLMWKPNLLLTTFIVLMSCALIYQYFISGIYNWHIKQPGNIASIFYILSLLLSSYFIKRSRLKLFLLPLFIISYSVLTNVLGSLLIVFYFLFSFYALGLKYKNNGLEIMLSYGLIVGILIKSILSIISNNLIFNEIIFFILVISTYIFTYRKENISLKNIKHNHLVLIYILVGFITVGLNIASQGYNHDSIWYPLRSNALYFYNDFFTDQGFYGQVHFYPKLWESLTNNIFTEYNEGYAASLTISLYLVLSSIVFSLFKKRKMINLIAVVTTPVILGLSFGIKTDFLLLLLSLIAFLGVERQRYDLLLSALLLSVAVKNSFVIIIIAILAYAYLNKNTHSINSFSKKDFNFPVVILSLFLTSILLYRTYLLTGVLVSNPSILVSIQELIGFDFKLPEDIRKVKYDVLTKIFNFYKMIFSPEHLGQHRFNYNGYLWALSIFILDKKILSLWSLVLLIAVQTGAILLGDGNYYIPITILLMILFLRKISINKNAQILLIVVNIFIALIANPNWRVSKLPSFDNICFSIFCSDERRIQQVLRYHKMDSLTEIINDKNKKYFLISKKKKDKVLAWQSFHRYNVAHISEFYVWNSIVPRYKLHNYINQYIDVLIIDNTDPVNFKNNFKLEKSFNLLNQLKGFKQIKIVGKWNIYEKK